jgi:two-component system KDP operon response regulator KdpE
MVRKQLIQIVDDEPAIVRLLRATLQANGYAVVTAERGEDALLLLENERPDLIILDLMMPGMDGFETLRRIRARSHLPVIMLTARAGDADKLKGLQGGADDYVTKPFNPDELVARVGAVLRRAGSGTPAAGNTLLRFPGLEIDLELRRVEVHGDEVRLSKTEWALLEQLAGNVGRVMLHRELLSRIWGPEFRDESQYLRTWVSRLRAKLQPGNDNGPITTFPGVGYRLELPPQETTPAAADDGAEPAD